jgi:hypothetical protein
MLETNVLVNPQTTNWQRRREAVFVVARASARTWAVAVSQQLIPGALFRTKGAALAYAGSLAKAAGLRSPMVIVFGHT